MCKTYPQIWGQNVDNVDNMEFEHIFCATCLVYHKFSEGIDGKTFYQDGSGEAVVYGRRIGNGLEAEAIVREVPETS